MCAIDYVLVGLDWVEPRMQFILHVTYSCISHAYELYFLIYLLYLNCVGAFLIVSFSLPLFLFTLVVSMAPKRKSAPSRNPLRSETSSSSSNPTPSHIRFHDEDARKAFSENFSRRGIHSERRVILADFVDTNVPNVIPMSFTVGVGSHCVTSQSYVHPCWSKSFTPTCMDLIFQYLILSLAFEVCTFLSHHSLLRMCFEFLV